MWCAVWVPLGRACWLGRAAAQGRPLRRRRRQPAAAVLKRKARADVRRVYPRVRAALLLVTPWPSIDRSVSPSINPSINTSIYPSINPSINLLIDPVNPRRPSGRGAPRAADAAERGPRRRVVGRALPVRGGPGAR